MASVPCSSLAFALLGCLAAGLLGTVKADGRAVFLGIRGQEIASTGGLLDELEEIVGRDQRMATEGRVDRLEEAMRSMFASMPKNVDGRLDSAGVRYLLHRVFVQRHGWFVHGLSNDGDSWNASSPVTVFEKHAEAHHGLFEQKLNSRGVSLHQVAVFAATLEILVHAENVERLHAAYRLQGLSESEANVPEEMAAKLVRAYMLLYTVYRESNASALTQARFDQYSRNAPPSFPDRVKFALEVRQRVLEDTHDSRRNGWDTMLRVVEEVGERYGRWQAGGCHELKGRLLEMEQPGTGRVRLEDFYGSKVHNATWQFTESQPYLKELGALDDSDARQTTVVIPNYLNSPANCVKSASKFYTVCCIDECEALLGTLENKVAAPVASPARIAEIVAALPSDTVEAPRALPAALASRLEQIATHHGGRVPLHGRLFAQWLHHAYPRECPYPHISGMTKPMTEKEWEAYSGKSALATWSEAHEAAEDRTIEAPAEQTLPSPVEYNQPLPWNDHEELFVSRLPELESTGPGAVSQGMMLLAVPFSALLMLLRWYAQQASFDVDRLCSKKHYV